MIVIDSSIALAWVLEEAPDKARAAADIYHAAMAGQVDLVAPHWMRAECAYVLLKKGRSARWGEAKTAEYAEFIDSVPVRYLNTGAPIASHIRFAVRHNVQGYDAVYLGLAINLGASLATFDGGLKSAARRASVELAT